MKIEQLKKLLSEFGDNVRFEYDLKKKNWFNIGGKSKVFFKLYSNLTFSSNSFNKFFNCLISITLIVEVFSSN